jgi:PAP2 superfamily C-terminal
MSATTKTHLCRSSSEIRDYLRDELGYLKASWPWLALFLMIEYFHSVAHNWVYYYQAKLDVYGGPENSLFDLGFEVFTLDLGSSTLLLSNVLMYIVAAAAVLFLLVPVFVKLNYSAVNFIWRTFFVIAISIILRCLSFSVTLLPSPHSHCSKARAKPPRSISDIFFRFDSDESCGDLIFSGHTLHTLSIVIGMIDYSKSTLIALLLLPVVFLMGIAIIAQRSHYTVDVVIALYTVPLVWSSLRHWFPNDPQDSYCFWRRPRPQPCRFFPLP